MFHLSPVGSCKGFCAVHEYDWMLYSLRLATAVWRRDKRVAGVKHRLAGECWMVQNRHEGGLEFKW